MARGLIGQTAIYTVANIVSRGAAVVALLIFPFILDAADYGALGLVMTLSALVQLVVPLEVSQGLARYYGTAPEQEKSGYGTAAWWFTLLSLGIAGVVALLFAEPLTEAIFGDPAYLAAFRLTIPFCIGVALFYFLQAMCRWKFMTAAYVVLSLAYSALTLGLGVVGALTAQNGFEGLLIGQGIATLTIGAVAMVWLRRDLFRRFDIVKLARMLRFSLPLVPASLAVFASLYAGRLILNAAADLADVGVFVFASQIAAIAGLAIIGVQSALTPYIMAHHREPETPAVLARFFEGFAMLAAVLCLAMGLFAPPLIAWLSPLAYAPAGPLVIMLSPATILMSMYIFWPGFAIAERTDQQLWVSLVGGATAIAANAVLIPLMGLVGAAIASLASALIFLVLWFIAANPLYPVPIRWRRVGLIMALYSAAAAASIFLPSAGALALALRTTLFCAATASIIVFGPVSARTISSSLHGLFQRRSL